MAKVHCPCGRCGQSFEPEVFSNGQRRKFFSPACRNRVHQRRHRAREKAENQANLKFQPAAKTERRKKGQVRLEPKPGEESMFA
jgi:hypothetical protein